MVAGVLSIWAAAPVLQTSNGPHQTFAVPNTNSVWWVGASSTDSSAVPNNGVRGTIQVISTPVVGCLAFWVSDDLSNSNWGQVGYYICNASTPVAFYQIWNLNSNTVLTTGSTSVSVGTHTFSMYLQSGTTWAYSLDGVVFGTYDMGASSSSSSYPVYVLSEEEANSIFTFPTVTFPTALQVMKSESWNPVQTAKSYGTGWGVAGATQGTGLQADQVTVGGSLAVLTQGTQLWGTGTTSTSKTTTTSTSKTTTTSTSKRTTTSTIPISGSRLALDGSGVCDSASTNTCNISLTTSSSPDVIIVLDVCASGSGCSLKTTSKPTSTGLTFTLRAGASAGADYHVDEYYAVVSSTLSSATVTCTNAANKRISCVAFGVSGANTKTIWDSNAAIPCVAVSTSNAPSCTISTSNANDLLIESISSNSATCAKESSFTLIRSECNDVDGGAAAAYEVVPSTQSSVAVTWSLGSSVAWVEIVDAIQAASPSTTTTSP